MTPPPMKLGTPLSPSAVRVMLLGSGELGKEVAISLQRLGVEVIAVDRYANAPAMQVAHRSHVIVMSDGAALRALIERGAPPSGGPRDRGHRHRRAGRDRRRRNSRNHSDGRRDPPHHEPRGHPPPRRRRTGPANLPLRLRLQPRRTANRHRRQDWAIRASSSRSCRRRAKGSRCSGGLRTSQTPGPMPRRADASVRPGSSSRASSTLTTKSRCSPSAPWAPRAKSKRYFCDPVGHLQVKGDYVESWQPQAMTAAALDDAANHRRANHRAPWADADCSGSSCS